jgi:hypothetical protein
MVTGRDPGDSTMIRVTYEVQQMLAAEKIIPREPWNDCVERLIKEVRKLREVVKGSG